MSTSWKDKEGSGYPWFALTIYCISSLICLVKFMAAQAFLEKMCKRSERKVPYMGQEHSKA